MEHWFNANLSGGSLWLLVLAAVLLGALHGFEPGHSKTMMAAFIIAIRGTVVQAVLLGVAATISHTAIIWILAGVGLHYAKQIDAEHLEPYFEIVTGSIVIAMAGWMFLRTRREERERIEHEKARAKHLAQTPPESAVENHAAVQAPAPLLIHTHDGLFGHTHDHGHEHSHSHSHGPGDLSLLIQGAGNAAHAGNLIILPGSVTAPSRSMVHGTGAHGGKMVDTGHGWLEVSIHGADAPSRFRIYACRASGQAMPLPKGTSVSLETARLDGSSQNFQFEAKEGNYWESTGVLPEPHRFLAILKMTHSNHTHTYRLPFGAEAVAVPEKEKAAALPLEDEGVYQDAHERAHAEDIKERFSGGTATTWQVILFGLTGGLMPCSAALTVLLLCLQSGRFWFGMMIVLAFSIGLAITLVAFGAAAALSLRAATKRFKNLDSWIRKMPYASSALMIVVGLVIIIQGVKALGGA